MNDNLWDAIAAAVAAANGRPFKPRRRRPVGGGCINDACVLEGDGESVFVKRNTADRLDMFTAEAEGLKEIARSRTVRVPTPICWGTVGGQAYLAVEYIDMGTKTAAGVEELGRRLARLHQVRGARFGWHRDNTIGATPQINTQADDWIDFCRQHRLGYQLALAAGNGYGGKLQDAGARLLAAMPAFFAGYRPPPVLLHGDLWSGNYGITAAGEPVIFDPAVYYGDREADLAMTELFGGFPPRFYHAYEEQLPLDPGYALRKTFYNLYHVLNHANLFGGAYPQQAEQMMAQLLSEIRG